MSEYQLPEWEPEEEKPRRPGIVLWLIVLLLICALLLPLLAPLLREFYLATQPTPTPVVPLKVAQLYVERTVENDRE